MAEAGAMTGAADLAGEARLAGAEAGVSAGVESEIRQRSGVLLPTSGA